jgi:hypothetical protein
MRIGNYQFRGVCFAKKAFLLAAKAKHALLGAGSSLKMTYAGCEPQF